MDDIVPCEKVFNNCRWYGLRFLWRDSMGQQQLLVQKHLLSMSYTNLSSTDPAASIFGSGVFHWPTVPTNRYRPHDPSGFCLPFAPLPLPHKFKVLSPRLHRRQSKEFQNRRVYRDGNMAVKSLSDKHNIIILILYFIREVWGKWQYEVFVTSKKSVLVGTYFL
jgi:hypothetical protein